MNNCPCCFKKSYVPLSIGDICEGCLWEFDPDLNPDGSSDVNGGLSLWQAYLSYRSTGWAHPETAKRMGKKVKNS